MVYNATDLNHLTIMDELENRKENLPNPTELINSALNTNSTPNDNLTLNILSLCNKLRSSGFDKYAKSIEDRFVMYKRAKVTHMYRTHDEDGEDLIEFAHPTGDVSVDENKNPLADIETIVSKHKKIVYLINKEPTGKLDNKLAKYVDYCRIVLGQEVEEKEGLYLNEINAQKYLLSAKKDLENAKNIAEGQYIVADNSIYGELTGHQLLDEDIDVILDNLNDALTKISTENMDQKVDDMGNDIKKIISNYKKIPIDKLKNRAKNTAIRLVNSAMTKIFAAGFALKGDAKMAINQASQIDVSKLFSTINNFLSGLNQIDEITNLNRKALGEMDDNKKSFILNLQKTAKLVVQDLTKILNVLPKNDTIWFNNIETGELNPKLKQVFSNTNFFKDVNSYDGFVSTLSTIRKEINDALKLLNLSEQI